MTIYQVLTRLCDSNLTRCITIVHKSPRRSSPVLFLGVQAAHCLALGILHHAGTQLLLDSEVRHARCPCRSVQRLVIAQQYE